MTDIETPSSTISDQPVLPAQRLSHTRTVDRGLVHRDSLGEVFLTDLLALDGDSYAVAAQLPRSHAYYGDHLLRPSMYDPLLLLEASRQAGLAAAHQFFGVPTDHKFILTHLRIHLTHPGLIVVGPAPCPLTMRVTVTDRKEREGLTTGVDSVHELSVNGVVIGHAEVGLRFRSPVSYLKLRLGSREGKALPSSATHLGPTVGAPLTPYLVGRGNPDVAPADVGADDETGPGADHVRDRLAPALPGAPAGSADQPALLEAADGRRHRWLRQLGGRRDLGPGDRSLAEDRLEDRLLAELAEQAQARLRSGATGPA